MSRSNLFAPTVAHCDKVDSLTYLDQAFTSAGRPCESHRTIAGTPKARGSIWTASVRSFDTSRTLLVASRYWPVGTRSTAVSLFRRPARAENVSRWPNSGLGAGHEAVSDLELTVRRAQYDPRRLFAQRISEVRFSLQIERRQLRATVGP